MDELRLLTYKPGPVRDADTIVLTETWLDSSISDEAVQLYGRTLFRLDRDATACGKTRGGGLCVYINHKWATHSRIINTHCCQDLEALTISCRPFHLPRELSNIIITAVYCPPNADVNKAAQRLHDVIAERLRLQPEAGFIVLGDFNKACLKTVLPRFVQHVHCATRGENTLDKIYTQFKGAYTVGPLPHLASSDHVMLKLIPTYTSRKRSPWKCGAS